MGRLIEATGLSSLAAPTCPEESSEHFESTVVTSKTPIHLQRKSLKEMLECSRRFVEDQRIDRP